MVFGRAAVLFSFLWNVRNLVVMGSLNNLFIIW